MTDRVIPIRPSPSPQSSGSSRSRPGPSPLVPVQVEWDSLRGLYVAVCDRCCDTLTTDRLNQAHDWADTHTCDPELAALLADITRRHVHRRAA